VSICLHNQSAGPFPSRIGAFTLIELLVVIAIIGILASMLLPSIARANEKAKWAKVRGELHCVGLALQMYSDDNDGKLPPVRVNCNSDMMTHWCEFPVELATQGYLPRGNKPGMAANMEDVFNPGHTYKYAAPGPCLLNGSPNGNYSLWVPDDYPTCNSTNGQYYSKPKDSPVRWVIWSLGPQPNSPESQDNYAPIASRSWYRHTGRGGVIPRMANRNDMQITFP
jgi:prepilin-type N-terminal cleavage/methylation domain-containing protein